MNKVHFAIEIHGLVSKGKIIFGKDKLYSEATDEIYVIIGIEMHYRDFAVWVRDKSGEDSRLWGSSFKNMRFFLMDRKGPQLVPFEDAP